MKNGITYRGYTIRKSGKMFRIITTGDQRAFFTRFVSVEAAQIAINCRLDGGRVMTSTEHKVTYPDLHA